MGGTYPDSVQSNRDIRLILMNQLAIMMALSYLSRTDTLMQQIERTQKRIEQS
jgi:hypothetical protein